MSGALWRAQEQREAQLRQSSSQQEQRLAQRQAQLNLQEAALQARQAASEAEHEQVTLHDTMHAAADCCEAMYVHPGAALQGVLQAFKNAQGAASSLKAGPAENDVTQAVERLRTRLHEADAQHAEAASARDASLQHSRAVEADLQHRQVRMLAALHELC